MLIGAAPLPSNPREGGGSLFGCACCWLRSSLERNHHLTHPRVTARGGSASQSAPPGTPPRPAPSLPQRGPPTNSSWGGEVWCPNRGVAPPPPLFPNRFSNCWNSPFLSGSIGSVCVDMEGVWAGMGRVIGVQCFCERVCGHVSILRVYWPLHDFLLSFGLTSGEDQCRPAPCSSTVGVGCSVFFLVCVCVCVRILQECVCVRACARYVCVRAYVYTHMRIRTYLYSL